MEKDTKLFYTVVFEITDQEAFTEAKKKIIEDHQGNLNLLPGCRVQSMGLHNAMVDNYRKDKYIEYVLATIEGVLDHDILDFDEWLEKYG